jgi:hypothetical protein
MDIHSGKIVDFKLVQKGQIKGDLERQACEQLLTELKNVYDCEIELLLTDRHKGIRKYIRTQHSKITHEFDIWHLSKSLMKRFKPLEKKYPDAFLWKSSINNHLWWSAQTCEGNGKLLVDKFISVLYHISNKHEWVENSNKNQC